MNLSRYPWLRSVLNETIDAESPRTWIVWAALFTVAVSTRRRVFMKLKKIVTLYPNLYVLLIGDAGIGKQFPIDLATNLLEAASVTRLITGRTTIEKLIANLSNPKTLTSGEIIRDATAALISAEFSNFLNDSSEATTILTELYDPKAHFYKDTLGDTYVARNTFVSLLGATNFSHLNNKIKQHDMEGGFLSRTLPLVESKVAKLDSLMGEESGEINYADLSKRLIEISMLEGRIGIDPDAAGLYDDWYHEFYGSVEADKTGFVRRFRVHVLKAAMCLSLVQGDSMMISLEHLQDAFSLCKPILDSVIEVGQSTGGSKYKSQQKIIIYELIKAPNHSMEKRKLIHKHIGEFSSREFAEIIETLIAGDYIEYAESRSGNEPMLRLTKRCIGQLDREKGA